MRVCVSARLLAICTFTSVLIACLSACGGGGSSSTPPTTKGYAVADSQNNRVLIFNAPFSTNQNASVVLGQADFTHSQLQTTAANTIGDSTSIAADSSGNLYVGDYYSCRVLEFKPPFTNNMNATVEIGQPDFTSSSTCAVGANSFRSVLRVAIDGNGDLWVSESENTSRILEFVPPLSNGMSATLVIGQTSLTSTAGCNEGQGLGSPTASSICGTAGMAFDSSGNLWVGDSNNSRVLEFKPPFSTNMSASIVLGQPNFTTDNTGIVSASTLDESSSLAFDASGNLWVADATNQRVLEFKPPFSNGMAASLELGQPSGTAFTSNNANTSQSGFNYPCAVSFDLSGNIQVADCQDSRVMIFDPPFSSGMNATTVLGQAGFSGGAANEGGSIGANTLDQPDGVTTF